MNCVSVFVIDAGSAIQSRSRNNHHVLQQDTFWMVNHWDETLQYELRSEIGWNKLFKLFQIIINESMQIVMHSRSNNKCKKGKFHWQINCSWAIIHPAAEGREKESNANGKE